MCMHTQCTCVWYMYVSLVLQDQGDYLVTAENSAGTSEALIKVTVLKPTPPEREDMFVGLVCHSLVIGLAVAVV